MGKLIAWGPDRASAIQLMSEGLDEFGVGGLTTSLELLKRIIAHADYRGNSVTTNWLDGLIAQGATH